LSFLRRCLAVFAAIFALDLVFAFYVAAVAAHAAFDASAWAAAIQLCNVVVVVSYVKDQRMVLPLALGAFGGTWVSVKYLF
jgi:hypothetical protein